MFENPVSPALLIGGGALAGIGVTLTVQGIVNTVRKNAIAKTTAPAILPAPEKPAVTQPAPAASVPLTQDTLVASLKTMETLLQKIVEKEIPVVQVAQKERAAKAA